MRSVGQYEFNKGVLRLGDGRLTNDEVGIKPQLSELPGAIVKKELIMDSPPTKLFIRV